MMLPRKMARMSPMSIGTMNGIFGLTYTTVSCPSRRMASALALASSAALPRRGQSLRVSSLDPSSAS